MAKPKSTKKRKKELVFDPKNRREFLTGFRKRKQERRQKAKEELEKQVKEERKRIKIEVREGFQEQFKQSFAPIQLEGKLKEEEYDTENVTVQIVELSPDEIAKSNNWIGSNKPVYELNGSNNKVKSNASTKVNGVENVGEEGDDDDDEEEEEVDDEEQVPGFTVTSIKKGKKRPPTTEADADENDDEEETKPKRKRKNLPESFSSKREIGHVLAKNVQNKLRQSKAFRTKAKLERVRDRKKARIEKDKRMKVQNKRDKHKKKPLKAGGAAKEKPPKFNKKGRGRK